MSQAKRLLYECAAVADQTVEGDQPKDPDCIFHVTSYLCYGVLELVSNFCTEACFARPTECCTFQAMDGGGVWVLSKGPEQNTK